MWDWIRHDVRAAVRLFLRRPGYGLMAAGTLAVGLGLNTIAFSAVNAPLFRAARIARGDSIGWLYLGTRSQPYADASLPLFERVRRDARTLETVVAEGRMPLACDSGNGTDQIWALVVSPDYFSTVRVPLAIAASAGIRRSTYAVDGDFFRALNVPLRAGRAFEPQDGAEAVIVNESAARLWPQANAVDRMFREGPEQRQRRVVGVVPDIVQRSLSESPRPHMYRTMRDADLGGPLYLVVRTDARNSDLVAPLRNAVRDVDPDLPVQSVQTMRERMALPLWLPRTIAGFFFICGGVAVLLATVGLFGVTYYLALQRTREFGVRLALGATRASLGGLVIGEAVCLATPGIVIGTAAAVGSLAAARTLLSEV